MNKTLIIAEKPSVALDISRALGGFAREGDYFESERYVLASSIGHLLSLVAPNDPVKGKWSFTHLPAIPPEFELGPTDKKSAERLKLLVRLAKRKDVDAMTSAPATIGYFTDTIAKLLTVTGAVASVSSDGGVATSVLSYVNLMEGKERAGQERAQGANLLATGQFDLPAVGKVFELVALQNAYFKLALASATSEQRAVFDRALSGAAVDKVGRMRQTITVRPKSCMAAPMPSCRRVAEKRLSAATSSGACRVWVAPSASV